MSVRNLAAAGIAVYLVGGPLLLAGLYSAGVGTSTLLGAGAVWAGSGLVLSALLQAGRLQHQRLRAQAEQVARLVGIADAADGSVDTEQTPAALDQRLSALEQTLDAQAEARYRELMRTVDSRIFGIHEVVRDLADVPRDRGIGERSTTTEGDGAS